MYFAYSHAPISCYFAHSSRDFVVQEIPLYDFSGSGEHSILKLRKKQLSTFELIDIIASAFSIPRKSIGYAGLKDKNATTTQYLSIPAKSDEKIAQVFARITERHAIKLLDITRHNNKLRLGHLKGNRFFVRLKKLSPHHAKALESILHEIAQKGFPNYFGFQRFGIGGDNYLLGRALGGRKGLRGAESLDSALDSRGRESSVLGFASVLEQLTKHAKPMKSPKLPKHLSHKMRGFMISSYQSFLFNAWLQARVAISAWLKDFVHGKLTHGELGDVHAYYQHALENALQNTLQSTWQNALPQAPQNLDSSSLESTPESSPLDSHSLDSSLLDHATHYLASSVLKDIDKQELLTLSQSLRGEILRGGEQVFALLSGDLCCHYPHGRLFTLESPSQEECARFVDRGFSPTGALCGENLKCASGVAGALEQAFYDEICAHGSRRYAWVWASEVEFSYKPEVAQAELHFSLPSGAYATSFLEQVLKRRLSSHAKYSLQ